MGFSISLGLGQSFSLYHVGEVSPACLSKMSFTNVGKVLPVLMSEADRCGRGFASLFMK